MAALVIRAIDQQTANAGGAHFSKGDFLTGVEHRAIEARAGVAGKRCADALLRDVCI